MIRIELQTGEIVKLPAKHPSISFVKLGTPGSRRWHAVYMAPQGRGRKPILTQTPVRHIKAIRPAGTCPSTGSVGRYHATRREEYK